MESLLHDSVIIKHKRTRDQPANEGRCAPNLTETIFVPQRP